MAASGANRQLAMLPLHAIWHVLLTQHGFPLSRERRAGANIIGRSIFMFMLHE
jgi:hypothetical protein